MWAIIWFHNYPSSLSQFHQALLRNKVLLQTSALCFLMKLDRIVRGMMDGDMFVNSLIVLTTRVNSETGVTTQVILTE